MTQLTLDDVRAAVSNGGGLVEQIDRVVVIERDPADSIVLVARRGAPDLIGVLHDETLTLRAAS